MRRHPRALLGVALSCALAGCANRLAFTTATKFALDVSQQADKNIDVSLGYDRAELAVIPAPEGADAEKTSDTYSVLGTFYVHYDNPFASKDPLRINQFFATGVAAQQAAKSPAFRRYFGRSAAVIQDNSVNSAPTFTQDVQKLQKELAR
jgi:hypothetical protein